MYADYYLLNNIIKFYCKGSGGLTINYPTTSLAKIYKVIRLNKYNYKDKNLFYLVLFIYIKRIILIIYTKNRIDKRFFIKLIK